MSRRKIVTSRKLRFCGVCGNEIKEGERHVGVYEDISTGFSLTFREHINCELSVVNETAKVTEEE